MLYSVHASFKTSVLKNLEKHNTAVIAHFSTFVQERSMLNVLYTINI